MKKSLMTFASALALSAGLASFANGADAFTLVTLTAPTAPGDFGELTGSFTDTLSSPGAFVADFVFSGPPPLSTDTFSVLAGAGVTFSGISLSYFAGGALPLDTTFSSTSITSSTVGSIIGGTYELEIAGTAAAGIVDSFTGTITAIPGSTTPVPEPETYALLLAGLAVVGAFSRRKSRKA